MTVVSQKFAHTPLSGSGLSIPEGNKQRKFAVWTESKELRNTEFKNWLGEAKDIGAIWDIEIGQSYAPFNSTTLTAQAGASDEQVTVASTALVIPGDTGTFNEFFSSSTTEYDDTRTEYFTVQTVDSATLMTVLRHQGAVADGSYSVHPTGTVVKFQGRAQNFLEPFPDGFTYRGDSIIVHPMRIDVPEITYDEAAVKTPDFEAPNGHWVTDVERAQDTVRYQLDWALINSQKVTGNHLSTPKIPYEMTGAIAYAELLAGNLAPVNGLLNFFDFTDIYEDLATNHTDGPGDTVWMHPRMFTIWNEMLMQYKGQFAPNDTTLTMLVTNVKSAHGNTNGPKTDNQWRPSKILITSKADWEWGHVTDRNWTYAERDRNNLGMWAKAWSMSGDFGLICKNISHQRILTGLDTRKNLYPARSSFQ